MLSRCRVLTRKYSSFQYQQSNQSKARFWGILVASAFTVYGVAQSLDSQKRIKFPWLLHNDAPTDASKENLIVSNTTSSAPKEKLVILGSGWGAVGVIKNLPAGSYDVTVISKTYYFLFTPLLPSVTVSTLEARSLIEPIRNLCRPLAATFFEASAEGIDTKRKVVTAVDQQGRTFEVAYDKLVIAVGAEVNTFGIPGVKGMRTDTLKLILENCYFLKTVYDARAIRNKIIANFEVANLPTTSPEERKRLLSFVIVGGGPTGVEVAGELYDLLNDDLNRHFPNLTREDASVTIVEGLPRILNMFDSKISDYAENAFHRQNVKLLNQAMVMRVHADSLEYKNTATGEILKVPYGMCLWSTGIGLTPFIRQFKDSIPAQSTNRCLVTDKYLRVKGIEDGSVFALGDCASIETPKLLTSAVQLFNDADVDHVGRLSKEKFSRLVDQVDQRHPHVALHFESIRDIYAQYDKDRDGALSIEEFKALLADVDKKIKSLPATAQVATQQGAYLGHFLSKAASAEETVGPFRYRHLGSFVYVGEDEAVFDYGWKKLAWGGYGTFWLWRSVFLSEQVTLRTRIMIFLDWFKTAVFGRDISKVQD